MKKLLCTLLWILGVIAAISLVLAVILKAIPGHVVYGVKPISCLRLTAVCSLAAIAISLINISDALKELAKRGESSKTES